MAGRSDIEAGKAHVTLYAKDAPLMKGLSGVQTRLAGLGTGIAAVGEMLAGLGASIIAPLTAAVFMFAETGAALDDMSQRTGVAASALAELGFAAEQSGASIDDVEKSIRRMQRTINDAATGMQSAIDALDQLGLSFEELEGIPPEEQFEKTLDALAAMTDATVQAALAQEIFGRSGTMLLPMLATYRELRAEARARGIIPTEEAVKAAAAFDDAFNAIRKTIGAVVFEVGAALAPALLPVLHAIGSLAAQTAKWVRENGELVRIIAAIGAGLLVLGSTLAVIGGVVIAVGALAGSIGALVAAIPAIVAAGPTIVAVLAGVLFVLGAVAGAMGIAKLAVEELDMSVGELVSSFLSLAKGAASAFGPLGGIVGLISAASPKIEKFMSFVRKGSNALVEQGKAAASAMLDIGSWAQSMEDATESIQKQTIALYDQAAAVASLQAKAARRASLVREFESPEERFLRKRNEIGRAMTEVNNQRVLGQISPEQAAAEMRSLQIAQARLEAAERERRLGSRPRREPLPRVSGRLPDIAAPVGSPAEIKQSATGTFSAAGAIALGFGGGTQQRMLRVAEDHLAETRAARKEARDRHTREPVAGP